jgi:hypothetical protein
VPGSALAAADGRGTASIASTVWFQLAGLHRIASQWLVVKHVLVTQRNSPHALHYQRGNLVLARVTPKCIGVASARAQSL